MGKDICDFGSELTSRVPGLAERVQFQVGDIISLSGEGKIPKAEYDHFMSLLVFLHIPDRKSLLSACYDSLRPGGTFVIEDFAAKPGLEFTEEEKRGLLDVVSAPTVTTIDQYINDL